MLSSAVVYAVMGSSIYMLSWCYWWRCLNVSYIHPRYNRIPQSCREPNEPRHDKTNKVSVRPTKTQISLGIRPVWSESSLSAWKNIGSLATHWTHSKASDQPGRMPKLIWVFAGLHSFCWFWHVVAQMKKEHKHQRHQVNTTLQKMCLDIIYNVISRIYLRPFLEG